MSLGIQNYFFFNCRSLSKQTVRPTVPFSLVGANEGKKKFQNVLFSFCQSSIDCFLVDSCLIFVLRTITSAKKFLFASMVYAKGIKAKGWIIIAMRKKP